MFSRCPGFSSDQLPGDRSSGTTWSGTGRRQRSRRRRSGPLRWTSAYGTSTVGQFAETTGMRSLTQGWCHFISLLRQRSLWTLRIRRLAWATAQDVVRRWRSWHFRSCHSDVQAFTNHNITNHNSVRVTYEFAGLQNCQKNQARS